MSDDLAAFEEKPCPRCGEMGRSHRHVYQTLTFDPLGISSRKVLIELVCRDIDWQLSQRA